MSTKNKIALITGGSRGLGKNMALAIARKGIDVVITYHTNEAAANAVVAEIQSLGHKAFALQLDTAATKSFDAFINSLTDRLTKENGAPHFDFLINNAGTALYAMAADTREEQLDDIFNIHYKGVSLSERWRRHHQYFIRSCPHGLSGLIGICFHEGGGGSALPLFSKGIRAKKNPRECRCARCH